MLKLQAAAMLLTVATPVSAAGQAPTQATHGLTKPPVVSAADAPAGTEALAVNWIRVAVPDRGVMLAAVARPSGPGPFPVVVLLHGAHGFARPYVQWAQDLARGGFLTVAGCWFSGGYNNGSNALTPLIPCPEMPPPKAAGAYPEAVQYIDALVQAARAQPGARPDRLALVGHSRGASEALEYILAIGNVQAAVLHAAGQQYRPATRAAEFTVPMLILHGTADENSAYTSVALARELEAALRWNQKPVEAQYYEGGGHNTFFTNPTQRDDELKRMIEFLRHRLGK